MNRAQQSQRGVTLMEIIIVIAIMMILLALTIQSFSKLGAIRALDTNAQVILLELEKARSLTLASKNESQFGVHFATTSVTLFEGSTYDASSASTTVTYFNPAVTITYIALTGSSTSVVFERLTGKTAQAGTITVTLSGQLSGTKTLRIYATGVAEIQ